MIWDDALLAVAIILFAFAVLGLVIAWSAGCDCNRGRAMNEKTDPAAVVCASASCPNRGRCRHAEEAKRLPRMPLLVLGRAGECVNFRPREVQS